ncbi:MAG: hypothetical protein A3J65_02655 [Candidatus Buchananbacteria bacterium RIFCSPHIGHO2_02_FULL_45_11b]|uniref:Transcription termination/antitermination protein NusA n=4 Tax=Candidatus Buchananiibacteriota TaxID=1817903 RepID=A0A1G1Y369_9BACT|nr:MAG: hypothetical protein A2663_00725 [Candidatus Buchananbacteria bacterium RIFCSPHIGHO2_01_FULL_46_12]OGY50779.1 MAG: hypothetical protein A3J65_02655 [Candidatus Buchananbacteria bacterium RIFCSPHIGHO2_02_FULL_45_11b]OGY52827.1 MAG: hypothetical protein A3B15_00870 [Candidatus Buchananbacteria bacterium RIFCSPLOWO2_01_FULL_45_31]OGY56452.1 MAG: hypothetical protein A3H67_05295 [Candidatus Buchananbacteria bacterium RIFCSPLOWO2_02_FULL_46_11b]
MDQASIAEAVKQICEEKGIPMEAVIATIEAALAAAYRKDFGEKNQNVKAEFNLDTGQIKVFDVKTVVEDLPPELLEEIKKAEAEGEKYEKREKREKRELKLASPEAEKREKRELKLASPEEEKPAKEAAPAEGEVLPEEEARRFNPKTEIQITDAKQIDKKYEINDEIKTPLEVPGEFGRMAAQTAKQVIIQKLRETEREAMFEEFKKREGEIMIGTIQRREGALVLVDLGKTTALLPPEEQIRTENYAAGAHLKVYVVSVSASSKGPTIIVSRAHPEIVNKLFALEIPEIQSGVVVIKSIAREAGSRSKIAVWTDQENIDPIGSCIGQRGARIQTIISELKGEKVDIIKYSEDPKEFIANALSPAKITEIKINEAEKTAVAKVPEDQLSLAIGRSGQNVRLAARLTGWKIDIVSDAGKKIEVEEMGEETKAEEKPEAEPAKEAEVETKTEENKLKLANPEAEEKRELKLANPEEKKPKKEKVVKEKKEKKPKKEKKEE